MIQLELLFKRPLLPSQKRSVNYLVHVRKWSETRAIAYYERYNERVDARKAARAVSKISLK